MFCFGSTFPWLNRFIPKLNYSSLEDLPEDITLSQLPPIDPPIKEAGRSTRPSRQQKNSAGLRSSESSSLPTRFPENTIQNKKMDSSQQLNEITYFNEEKNSVFTNHHPQVTTLLIDTADIHSVYSRPPPPEQIQSSSNSTGYPQEANNTKIELYNTSPITLDLTLDYKFNWSIKIADNIQPAPIGVIANYRFMIDPMNRMVIDSADSFNCTCLRKSNYKSPLRLHSSNIFPNEQDNELDERVSQQTTSRVGKRVFVTDQHLNNNFLVDGGTERSIFPRSKLRDDLHELVENPNYHLQLSDGRKIPTYGMVDMNLNLGSNKTIMWKFIIADVQQALLGADFLDHYELFANHRDNCIDDIPASHTHKRICCQLHEYFHQMFDAIARINLGLQVFLPTPFSQTNTLNAT